MATCTYKWSILIAILTTHLLAATAKAVENMQLRVSFPPNPPPIRTVNLIIIKQVPY